MPSILFGAASSPERVGRGEFDCPECLARRRYRRTRVARRLRLLGAVLPAGSYGEHVECEGCHSTFRLEVLAYDAGGQTPLAMGEYQRALRRILSLMVAADGVVREPEIRTVQEIFEAVTGKVLSRDDVLAEVRDAAQAPMSAARFLARVLGYLNENGKEQILRGAALVSRSDGELHAREAEVVQCFGGVLHVARERVERILEEAGDGWTADSSPGPSN